MERPHRGTSLLAAVVVLTVLTWFADTLYVRLRGHVASPRSPADSGPRVTGPRRSADLAGHVT
ncbi:hypothetical protein [Streptomyces sp. NPDC046939]|uniref:hypothetical protein n=1 Tax=Streptomyces sp. NPDC046939 TaxID=3155376 RepID=UPI003411155E